MAPVLLAGVLAVLAGCNTVQPEKDETPSPAATRHQRLEGTPWMQDLDTRPSLFTPHTYAGSVTLPSGISFFSVWDELHGMELWTSDGTEAGTRLVKELNPGLSARLHGFTDVQGTVYFSTQDDFAIGESTLWKTDGTAAGTVAVKHLPFSGNDNYEPISDITHVQGTVYFIHRGQLWKSDGTAAGTTLFQQLAPDDASVQLRLDSSLGLLFFQLRTAENGTQLWRTDGTATGTVFLTQLTSPTASWYDSTPLVTMGGAVYFLGGDDHSQLWKSDGTPEGTVLVSEMMDFVYQLSVTGSTLFLTTYGTLWKSDGTAAGTQQVRSFQVSSWENAVHQLTSVNGTAYFTLGDPDSGTELWRSDGTEAGTFQVVDLWPGSGSSRPHQLLGWKNQLYFVANANANTLGLWTSDGTAANTTLLQSWPASPSLIRCGFGCPQASFLPMGNALFVQPAFHDGETWRTDGTVAGTRRLESVHGGNRGSQSRMRPFAVIDQKVFFATDDGSCGKTLRRSDGTSAGTVSLTSIRRPCDYYSSETALSSSLRVGSTFFFVSYDSTHGTELWRSDGTPTGTFLLKDIFPGSGSSRPNNLMALNGTLFFYADDGVHGQELWKSDGTETGTVLVKDVRPGRSGTYGETLTVLGGLLYFTADDGTHGDEPWKSDGTEAGTVLLEDIRPGLDGSHPNSATVMNGRLFFSADDGVHGRALWKSDGTEAGTVLVKDVNPGLESGHEGEEYLVVDGLLYFMANDGVHGWEPWKSDGTEAGTVLIKDLNPGAGNAWAIGFTRAGNNVVFAAFENVHGLELWRTDGTESGTFRLTDLRQGPSSGLRFWSQAPYENDYTRWSPFETLALEDKGLVLFTGVNEANGAEPWVTDGTPEGTRLVADLVPGPESSEPMSFARLDADRVFFFAADATHGREPHTLSIAHLGTSEVDLGSSTGPVLAGGDTCGRSNAVASTCGNSQAPDRAYTWTAPFTGTVTFTTAGSSYDTVLQLVDVATGATLGCNDDAAGTRQSSLTVAVTRGQQLRLVVDGSSASCGAFTLNFQLVRQGLGSVLGDAVARGDTCGRPDEVAPTCGGGKASADHAYTWTAPSTGTFTFTTAGSSQNTVLQVNDLATGTALGCNDDVAGTLQSSVSVSLTAGQSVLVSVEGFGGGCGAFTLNIQGLLDCSTLRALSAGESHTVALDANGTAWAWGLNAQGQLGDDTVAPRSTPVRVQGLPVAMALVAGGFHTVALKPDGTVWTWGHNGYGQLGDGTLTNRSRPVQVTGLPVITAIAAGTYFTAALDVEGNLWAWGHNGYGQLGDETLINRSRPVRVVGLSGVTALIGGGNHTVARTADGSLWAWGDNQFGQLGDGTLTNRSRPMPVLNLSNVTLFDVGGVHTVALKSDGSLWAWGRNNYGQLGDGTTLNRSTPVLVASLPDVTDLAAGAYHTVARKQDGTLWAWGYNVYGTLGDGTTTQRTTPKQVAGLSSVIHFVAGGYHTVALTSEGSLRAWGRNHYGQLGNGITTHRSTPRQVQGLTGLTALDGGENHTVTLEQDGTVWSWGRNDYGQLGDGTTLQRSSAVQVKLLSGVTHIAVGAYHSVALKQDGTVWAWGRDDFGSAGAGTPVTRRPTPVQVQNLSGVLAIGAGGYHSVALKGDGTVWAWGRNNYGQLGDGTLVDSATPVQVQGLSGVTQLAVGGYHAVALKADGTLWSWGYNAAGQLGNGTTTRSSIPVRVTVQAQGPSGITFLDAGLHHTLAVAGDGTLWAWGDNAAGQLGDGTTLRRLTPVPVPGLSGVTRVTAGTSHTAAVTADGSVWAWGRNHLGQLGDTTTISRTTPVQVRGLSGVLALGSGTHHTMALDAGGNAWLWGNNDFGALGEGTLFQHTTPVLVQGLSGVCASKPGVTPKRGLTWVLSETDSCKQTRVVCNDCDPYVGDTLCTESRPLLCIKQEALSDCSAPLSSTDGWSGGTVALTPFLVRGTELTSLAAANALCASTFGAGYRMAEHHDGGGGWGFRAKGSITPLATPASTHPRFNRLNQPHRFWVHIKNQQGNCWN
jgi:ELWxxDGT repeat protein